MYENALFDQESVRKNRRLVRNAICFLSSSVAVLLATVSLNSCASAPKELVAKPYSALYDASPRGCGYRSWKRQSDGNGKFRNEILKENGKIDITVIDGPQKQLLLFHPRSKTYEVKPLDPSYLGVNEGLDRSSLEPPKAPYWSYKESTKIGKHKVQLWQQVMNTGSTTTLVSMWYGEETGCPIAIEMRNTEANSNGIQTGRFTLADFKADAPDSTEFDPPSDYEEHK